MNPCTVIKVDTNQSFNIVCVRVCVCVWERERERDNTIDCGSSYSKTLTHKKVKQFELKTLAPLSLSSWETGTSNNI